jgi:hypothetical protein
MLQHRLQIMAPEFPPSFPQKKTQGLVSGQGIPRLSMHLVVTRQTLAVVVLSATELASPHLHACSVYL